MHLDVFGNHANSACASAAGGLVLRHKGMEQAVNTFSERAGCVARRPKTHHLLLGQFTPAECAAHFQIRPFLGSVNASATCRPDPRETDSARSYNSAVA